jgi:hypothetical protein
MAPLWMALVRVESTAWKIAASPVADSASPEVDWYRMTPSAMGSLAVAPVSVLDSCELRIRMVLSPSMPAIWLPEAVPVTLSASMSPVEYSSGEPEPAVESVLFVTETEPPPRSVAAAAQWSPWVSMVMPSARIVPP